MLVQILEDPPEDAADQGARVVYGPGENAGVVDIGDGDVVVFKMESHNHPSYIEPYQGATTGVGGILRDVFTMGARPIAALNFLRFGEPSHPKTKSLVAGVVAGIGGYGNSFGVPTVGGSVGFHARYNGNCLVNAMAVGLAKRDGIFTSQATGVGLPSSISARRPAATASMAPRWPRPNSTMRRRRSARPCRSAIPSPRSSCWRPASRSWRRAASSRSRTWVPPAHLFGRGDGAKGDLGVEMDLDALPCRESGMTAYEMMLSESQERMLMVLKPEKEAEARAIFTRWGLDFAVVGRTTDTLRFVIKHGGETKADLPIKELGDQAPEYDRPWVEPAKRPVLAPGDVKPVMDDRAALLKLIGSPDFCSKRWVWEQYDSIIGGNTLQRPGGDAAVVRIGDGPKALALTCDVTPRYVEADPFEGGKQAVAETWRNITASGGVPLAITDNLNFGNPERPEIMGQFVMAIRGIGEAARELDYPVVSGNVSLYNETNGQAILPTPSIAASACWPMDRRT